MSAEDDAGTKLRALGWHQGALIEIPHGSPVSKFVPEGTAYALVASQDCDVVAHPNTESHVDLLPARVVDESNGALQHGKHPRRLCLQLADGRFATVDVRQRVTISKEAVTDLAPLHPSAPQPDQRRLLARWLGKRYTRHAFPDAFNERLRAQHSKLERLSKKQQSALVTAIFLILNSEEELVDGVDYEVVMWFACRRGVAEDSTKRPSLEAYAKSFADAVHSCDGIKVVEHEVRSHFDITLEDFENLKRFDYDFRSEAPKPGGDVARTDGH